MKIVNTVLNSNIEMKICLIADIHFSYKFKLNLFKKIIDNIKMNRPDYICVTGDIIDYTEIENKKDINELYNFIKELGKITKTIIILGNHDITSVKRDPHGTISKYINKYPNSLVKNIKKIKNVSLLVNEIYEDGNIRFIGYEESYEAHYDKKNGYKLAIKEINNLIDKLDNKKYNILLSHNPLYLTDKKVYKNIKNFKKLNLILSGHTHNGMLPNFIKTNNLLISPMKKWFVKDGKGHMVKDGVDIIVTGGITKLSERAKIFNIFNFVYDMNIDYIIGGNNGGFKSKK